MSFVEPRFSAVVKNQFLYKWNSFSGLFISLIMVQLLGGLLSFNPMGSSGFGIDVIHTNLSLYSAGFLLVLTYVWAAFSGFLITNRSWQNDDYLFVASRTSSTLANMLILGLASFAGGTTAMMWTFVLKIVYIRSDNVITETGTQLSASPGEVAMGVAAASLYTFLCALSGYTAGLLWTKWKLLLAAVPFLAAAVSYLFPGNMAEWLNAFFLAESSFWLFVLKAIGSAAILLLTALAVSKRLEVQE